MRFKGGWLSLGLALSVGIGLTACSDDDDDVDPVLLAPTGLQVTQTSTGLQLTWNAATGATAYAVERDIIGDAEGYVTIATGITATSYVDEDVETGMTYQYRVLAVRGSETSAPSNEVEFSIGRKEAVLSGAIRRDRTLSADTTYILRGAVTVDSAVTLTIPAGTLILGDADVAGSALIVRRGGKLIADGRAGAPIVFTSSRPAGSRNRGDWGGIVLNGLSTCNFPADQCVGEGSSGPYGGNDPDDDSGVLRYVRIEFAGYEVSFGNELNGLTLNGVGSGTTIEYVQSHMGSDDGIEWFGGTVNARYLLVTGASDDSFDYSTGWSGKGQFWIALQDPDDADTGFEVDNNEEDYDASPLTRPTIYNVTLIGKAAGAGTAGESTRALLLRRGTGGELRNFIVLGFEVGLDIDNAETYARCASGDLLIAHSIFHGSGAFLDGDDDDETVCTGLPAWTLRQVDPGLVAPFDWSAPDFRPAAGSAALSDYASPPASDPFFQPVDFVGGVSPVGTPWYQGWTTFARN
jgi:hypothetical protein